MYNTVNQMSGGGGGSGFIGGNAQFPVSGASAITGSTGSSTVNGGPGGACPSGGVPYYNSNTCNGGSSQSQGQNGLVVFM